MKKIRRISEVKSGRMPVNIALMLVFLICGIVCGCLFAGCTSNDFGSSVKYEDLSNGALNYSFLASYFNFIKYPALFFFMGFTAVGIFFVPILVSVKGFFITVSISSLIKIWGIKGLYISLAVFGLQTMISIPVILFSSAFSFEFSKVFFNALRSKKNNVLPRHSGFGPYFMFYLIIVLILVLFALLDVLITPALFSLINNF